MNWFSEVICGPQMTSVVYISRCEVSVLPNRWISTAFCTDICGSQRMHPNDFKDPLTFHLLICTLTSRVAPASRSSPSFIIIISAFWGSWVCQGSCRWVMEDLFHKKRLFMFAVQRNSDSLLLLSGVKLIMDVPWVLKMFKWAELQYCVCRV